MEMMSFVQTDPISNANQQDTKTIMPVVIIVLNPMVEILFVRTDPINNAKLPDTKTIIPVVIIV